MGESFRGCFTFQSQKATVAVLFRSSGTAASLDNGFATVEMGLSLMAKDVRQVRLTVPRSSGTSSMPANNNEAVLTTSTVLQTNEVAPRHRSMTLPAKVLLSEVSQFCERLPRASSKFSLLDLDRSKAQSARSWFWFTSSKCHAWMGPMRGGKPRF